MMSRLSYGLALVFPLVFATAHAQTASDIVKWTAKAGPKSGSVVPVMLSAKIEPGWHIYAPSQEPGGPTAMTFRIPAGQPYALAGAVKSAPPIKKHDDNFQMDTVFYEGAAKFTVPVKQDGAAKGPIPVDVRFQTCNASLCLPPTTVHLTASAQ